MPLWPNNRRDLPGWQSTQLLGASAYLAQHFTAFRSREIAMPAAGLSTAAAWPTGSAIPRFALTLPIDSGAMGCRIYPTMSATANLLRGGPMQAAATTAMTMATPSLGLTVGMSAPWSGTFTGDSSLRLTIGMSAPWSGTFAGAVNLAMIVPLGHTTWSGSFVGSVDLRGRLSMSAEFGGPTPLALEVADAVWSKVLS